MPTIMGIASYLHIAFSPETFSQRSCFPFRLLRLLEEVGVVPEVVVDVVVMVVLVVSEEVVEVVGTETESCFPSP